MSDLTQKKCPAVIIHTDPETGDQFEAQCEKRAIRVDRDRYGKRTCECGNTWYPSKVKAA